MGLYKNVSGFKKNIRVSGDHWELFEPNDVKDLPYVKEIPGLEKFVQPKVVVEPDIKLTKKK